MREYAVNFSIEKIYTILKRKNWNNTETNQLRDLLGRMYDQGRVDKLNELRQALEIEYCCNSR